MKKAIICTLLFLGFCVIIFLLNPANCCGQEETIIEDVPVGDLIIGSGIIDEKATSTEEVKDECCVECPICPKIEEGGGLMLLGEGEDLTTGLLAYWNMDGNADDSVDGYDLTLYNAPLNGTDYGIINEGYYFQGTDEYSTGGDVLEFESGDISIQAWVYFPSTSTSYSIVERRKYGASAVNYALSLWNGKMTFAYYYPYTDHIYQTTTYVSAGEYHHVVATYTFGTGNSIKIYLDNVLLSGSWVYGNGNNLPPTDTTKFYVVPQESYFIAYGVEYVDEIGIWNRILDSDEVALLWNDGEGWAYPFEEEVFEFPLNTALLYFFGAFAFLTTFGIMTKRKKWTLQRV